MLGKTAGSLYWMARYLERSENNARLIDAGFRIALTRSSTARSEWRSVLVTAGQDFAFRQAHGEDYISQRVVDFLLRDPANRSEEHTSELQSLMRISYAVFCLKKNKKEPAWSS